MGRRGPKPKPVHVKRMQGNPGHRPIPTPVAQPVASPLMRMDVIEPHAITMPDYLTEPREQALFAGILADYFQRRVAHPVDVHAYARWAFLMHRWIIAKEGVTRGRPRKLKKNAQGAYYRDPFFRDALDLERLLQAQEDRLGLNPISRQNILKGLAQMPAPFTGDKTVEASAEPERAVASPIGIGRTVN